MAIRDTVLDVICDAGVPYDALVGWQKTSPKMFRWLCDEYPRAFFELYGSELLTRAETEWASNRLLIDVCIGSIEYFINQLASATNPLIEREGLWGSLDDADETLVERRFRSMERLCLAQRRLREYKAARRWHSNRRGWVR